MEEMKHMNLLEEVTEEELDAILGAGNGVIKTISHECHMNSWQWIFTCCS
ncbi:type A2 lantipeptide [Vagococcus sp. BWB3-3]|uniref:Lantibiotic n=1 Tax=Vagococcus allomyrinae TaxID=2794353 RepID=A0A940P6S3_9ENTE|nr:lacticin 481 family lantibiotic [Vagococcus allomyrinae]MBP1042457.1 type A2 lantipeptide [Vagococcus allomyrinae]